MAQETDERSISMFMQEVAAMVGEKASQKGYSSIDSDGYNPLLEVTGMEHATGELICKSVRYRSKRDPSDMVKAAGWAFLIWKYHT